MAVRNKMFFGFVAYLLFASSAYAVDLNGAWANDVSVCQRIFVKNHNRFSFAQNADFYGSGFIINGNQLVGKLGKCRVTRRNVQGNKIQLTAECATDIAVSPDQFTLRVDSNDTITRLFSTMGIEMQYHRCPQ